MRGGRSVVDNHDRSRSNGELGTALPIVPKKKKQQQQNWCGMAETQTTKHKLRSEAESPVCSATPRDPDMEYMKLPASQYSVLDAERIERIDDNTFRCFVYRFKFLAFEVCPVLVVRVNEHPLGTCINLLSCKLEGSPIVVAQNHKFEASMVNLISCDTDETTSALQQLTSDAVIQVSIDIPFPFRAIPVETIESSGTRVLEQILGIMLPRFMKQILDIQHLERSLDAYQGCSVKRLHPAVGLAKDYEAWASGDTSRQPLGTGQI
ncbi:hypothetical protein KSS87_006971 [Heliosperma pusillum]|nr:hypothetical protein KSS87_006971 [Heliosperma pusillum]